MASGATETLKRAASGVSAGQLALWGLQVVVSIALTIGGWNLMQFHEKQSAMDERQRKHNERITILEAKEAVQTKQTEESIKELKQGMKDINAKLDRLLERRP